MGKTTLFGLKTIIGDPKLSARFGEVEARLGFGRPSAFNSTAAQDESKEIAFFPMPKRLRTMRLRLSMECTSHVQSRIELRRFAQLMEALTLLVRNHLTG